MIPFNTLTSVAVPLDMVNVDTDRIVPARFLRQPRSAGYQNFLFHDLREKDPRFPLDRPEYRGAQILVAAENFGCGSSREAAVWALAGAGLRAWIAPSFGDIFFENSFKNGALPRKTKELIMIGICCALNRPRGVKLHSERALTLGVAPREVLEAIEVVKPESIRRSFRHCWPTLMVLSE